MNRDTHYQKGGSAGSKGVEFQVNALTIALLNSLQSSNDDWRLSTENKAADKFDDVVLERSQGDILVQTKFRENRTRISWDELLPSDYGSNSKKDDFWLPKYFLSYQKIKSKFNIKNVAICTNGHVNIKVLTYTNRDSVAPGSALLCAEGRTFYTLKPDLLPDLKASTTKYFQNQNIKETFTDEDLEEFIQKLQLYFEYTSGAFTKMNVNHLLSDVKRTEKLWSQMFHEDIYPKMMRWYQHKDGEYLTRVHALAILFEIGRDNYWKILDNYNVTFDSDSLLNLHESNQIFHVLADCTCVLREIQTYETLWEVKDTILYLNPNEDVEAQVQVVKAFALPRYTHLILVGPKIEDQTIINEMCNELIEILETRRYKKVVLIAQSSNRFAENFKDRDGYALIEESVTFGILSEETQEWLLERKTVNFQGAEISLVEMFENQDADYGAALNPNTLERLVRQKMVRVGIPLYEFDENAARHYIPRTFKRYLGSEEEEQGNMAEEIHDVYCETTICEVREKFIIITGGVELGKTMVLTRLAVHIKEREPHLWVIRIELDDYIKALREAKRRNQNGINARELLDSIDTTKLRSGLEQFVFDKFTEKVLLILDGLDKVSPDYTELMLNLLDGCRSLTSFAKVFVSTQPDMTEPLEAKLETKPFQLEPFTTTDQVGFLVNYWAYNLSLDKVVKKRCEVYAGALVSTISSWACPNPWGGEDFAKRPLHLRKLGEIFQENRAWDECGTWQGCKEYLTEQQTILCEREHVRRLCEMFGKVWNRFINKDNSGAYS